MAMTAFTAWAATTSCGAARATTIWKAARATISCKVAGAMISLTAAQVKMNSRATPATTSFAVAPGWMIAGRGVSVKEALRQIEIAQDQKLKDRTGNRASDRAGGAKRTPKNRTIPPK